jgi:hypothetical protein
MEAATAGLRSHPKRFPGHPLSAKEARLASPFRFQVRKKIQRCPAAKRELRKKTFSPHRGMAVRLAQHRTEEARFFGEMRQVQSLEVPLLSEHPATAKQPSFLAERAQPFEEMRWLPQVLQGSERRQAGTS